VILGCGRPPRDDAATGAALARLAPGAPLLVLNAPADVDLRALAPPGQRVEFLAKPFDAYTLRVRVRELLAPERRVPRAAGAVEDYRRFLEFPFLSSTAAVIARRAVTTDLPVLFIGERGTGAIEVGRAIHFFSGVTGPFTILACDRLDPGALMHQLGGLTSGADAGTVFLNDVDRAAPPVQQEILALVRGHHAATGDVPRVLAASAVDLEALAARGDFLAELAYALGTMPLALAPLRDRSADIPFLVESLSAALVARLRLAPVTYTEAALTRLASYLWFGNVAELEAVLGRTLALHRPRVVEAEHLVFFPADAPVAVSTHVTSAARPRSRPAAGVTPTPDLEILLGELAHELRNPMVTIKTFAQHLDNVLEDPTMRARFASLTSDAIARMDALLETLLDFARFRAPTPQPIDLRLLLDRALAERADEFARKHVRIDRNGTGASLVNADEAQVLFALRNLLVGVAGALVPHEPVRVRLSEAGVLELVLRAERSTAERLAGWIEGAEGRTGADTAPLPFALAAALIRRNGGSLQLHATSEGATMITLTLPAAGTPETTKG
jgi:DNA-binding NtrC family response regulator